MNQRSDAPYDQNALDVASREVHMMLLREGSSWGTKACEEMGRVFMTAYLKAAPLSQQREPVSEIGPIDPEFIKAVQDTRHSNEWVGIAFRNRLYTNTLYAAPQPPVSEGAGSNTACHPAAESASSSRCVVGTTGEWGQGPNGDDDVIAYINDHHLLMSLLYDLNLLPEQHPDHESQEWEKIFAITNHWREQELMRHSGRPLP